MPYKDLHDDAFDETTIAKLEIFEDYAQAWLPTFIMQKRPTICIFDFFAGTGYDISGTPGSPIRILSKIKEQIGLIFNNRVKVKVFLNEYEPNKREQKKFILLQEACNEYLEKNQDVKRAIEIIYYNEDFEKLFPKIASEISQYPALVYLDQNGIKFLSDKYLLELEKMQETDFLYFVSASYFWRFGNGPEFKEHLNIDMEAAKREPYKQIHRNILAQLRSRLPANSALRLYPFSLKKGSNIHGIIFGATHPRAVDKFLSIAWKRNEINGEANFDMDDDGKKVQLDFFETKKLTKIESFKKSLRDNILSGVIKNNAEVLAFVYNEGHIGSHAAKCLKEMKSNGEIAFDGVSPLVTYDNVHKNQTKKLLEYRLLKNEV